jgi:hypothetical protein
MSSWAGPDEIFLSTSLAGFLDSEALSLAGALVCFGFDFRFPDDMLDAVRGLRGSLDPVVGVGSLLVACVDRCELVSETDFC